MMCSKRSSIGWHSVTALIAFLFVSAQVMALTLSPTSVVDQSDLDRMKSLVQLSSPLSSNSLANIYYSLQSQSLLSQPIAGSSELCNHLKSLASDQSGDTIYYVTSAAKLLTNCQVIPRTCSISCRFSYPMSVANTGIENKPRH